MMKIKHCLLLLSSLPNCYETLITTLLVGKEILKVGEVINVLLEKEKLKRSNDQSEGNFFVTRSNCSRSMPYGNNFGRNNSKSSSMPRLDYKEVMR